MAEDDDFELLSTPEKGRLEDDSDEESQRMPAGRASNLKRTFAKRTKVKKEG